MSDVEISGNNFGLSLSQSGFPPPPPSHQNWRTLSIPADTFDHIFGTCLWCSPPLCYPWTESQSTNDEKGAMCTVKKIYLNVQLLEKHDLLQYISVRWVISRNEFRLLAKTYQTIYHTNMFQIMGDKLYLLWQYAYRLCPLLAFPLSSVFCQSRSLRTKRPPDGDLRSQVLESIETPTSNTRCQTETSHIVSCSF